MTDHEGSPAHSSSRARPGAHPVTNRRLPASLLFGRIAARVLPRGARDAADAPRTGSVQEIVPCKRSLLVTYRRDGTPVSTPVWAAVADGRLYVRTERAAGKVKRLRRDPRMLVAPCTVRGKPLGPPFEATARVLPLAEEPLAERTLARRYGSGRALFERSMDLLRVDMGYLEITPGGWVCPEETQIVTGA
ncbi:MAG TPA: PPOX class F420-dependent oxidoreductase [Solirubrobacteraceae bacterium]